MKKTIILLSALTLVSCGARKVNKSETEVKTEVTTTLKDTTSKVSETKTNETVNTFTDELEITPIDTTKAIEVIDSNGNKQTYFNAKIKRKQTQVNKSVDTEIKVAENGLKTVKTSAKQTIEVATKETERKGFNFWHYLGFSFFILLLLFLTYVAYKNRNRFDSI
jgi:hypothetical protein